MSSTLVEGEKPNNGNASGHCAKSLLVDEAKGENNHCETKCLSTIWGDFMETIAPKNILFKDK
jgi:hypothetical protein